MNSNALASQVINITLGTGLPFFIDTLVVGQPLVVKGGNMQSTVIALVLAVSCFLGCAINCTCAGAGGLHTSAYISRRDGIVLVALYVALNVFLIFDLHVAAQPKL